MVQAIQIHSPQGSFDTSLFSIAQRAGDRLAKDSRDKAAQAVADYGQPNAYPFMRSLALGAMNGEAINGLSYILGAAVLRDKRIGSQYQLSAVRQNASATLPDCSLRAMMDAPTFSHQDAFELKRAVSDLKDDLLDLHHYDLGSCEVAGNDALYYSRSFEKDEQLTLEALKYLVVAYAGTQSDAYELDRDTSGRSVLHIDAAVFRDIVALEYQPYTKQL